MAPSPMLERTHSIGFYWYYFLQQINHILLHCLFYRCLFDVFSHRHILKTKIVFKTMSQESLGHTVATIRWDTQEITAKKSLEQLPRQQPVNFRVNVALLIDHKTHLLIIFSRLENIHFKEISSPNNSRPSTRPREMLVFNLNRENLG